MNIVITGATGLVGEALVRALRDSHNIVAISRDVRKASKQFPKLSFKSWDYKELSRIIEKSDVVINLAGENIGAKYWTAAQKQKILSSRINATQQVVKACCEAEVPPRIINASAIGIYGLQPTPKKQKQIAYNEKSPLPAPPVDFLSEVGVNWEADLEPAVEAGLNVVRLRFAVILSKQGGMLQKLLLPFKLGLGGRVGSGEQPLSWVTLTDVVRLIEFILEDNLINGALNVVAPQVVTQQDFANTLAKLLNRPSVIPMPSCWVKLLFGQMGKELLLAGQAVESTTLPAIGFRFKHQTLEEGLRAALFDTL